MATARDIVTNALISLRVLASGGVADASEMADGIQSLNEMLAAWAIDGIDLEQPELSESDEVDLPDSHLIAIRYNLAADIADSYGAQLSPRGQMLADEGKKALRALYFTIADLEADFGLYRGYLAGIQVPSA